MQAPGDTHVPGSFRRPTQPARADNNTSFEPLDQLPDTSEISRIPPRKKQRTMAQPHSAVGQFAFAPATQQTTVTTTTTTTVSLEPFILRPPVDLADRDPKQYPLAFSPTPVSMRSIGLEVGGMRASFKEADDTDGFLQKVGAYYVPYRQ